MVFCNIAVFICFSLSSLISVLIRSLPSANAMYSPGLVNTYCALASLQKGNKVSVMVSSIVLIVVGDFIDRLVGFSIFTSLSDDGNKVAAFLHTQDVYLWGGAVATE